MRNIFFILLFSLMTTASYSQTKSYQLSSHILDISTGTPAIGVTVKLEKLNEKAKTWSQVDSKMTDENGRIKEFLDTSKPNVGVYRLTFLVADYFKRNNVDTFYPFIEVVFQIKDANHYHVPITLSPYGYATYRGN